MATDPNPTTPRFQDWDHDPYVRLGLVIRARNIMRAILSADERGQGVNFHDAMDAAEAFCCQVEASYGHAMKDQTP